MAQKNIEFKIKAFMYVTDKDSGKSFSMQVRKQKLELDMECSK